MTLLQREQPKVPGLNVYLITGRPDEVVAEQVIDDLLGSGASRALFDIRGLEEVGPEARAVCYRRAQEFRDVTLAILGSTMFHRLLITFLLFATGHRRARYFTDEQEALRWLQTAKV